MLHRVCYAVSASLAIAGFVLVSQAPVYPVAGLHLVGTGAGYLAWGVVVGVAGWVLHATGILLRTYKPKPKAARRAHGRA